MFIKLQKLLFFQCLVVVGVMTQRATDCRRTESRCHRRRRSVLWPNLTCIKYYYTNISNIHITIYGWYNIVVALRFRARNARVHHLLLLLLLLIHGHTLRSLKNITHARSFAYQI